MIKKCEKLFAWVLKENKDIATYQDILMITNDMAKRVVTTDYSDSLYKHNAAGPDFCHFNIYYKL